MRGRAKPALRMQASVKLNARAMRSFVSWAGTSAREMCEGDPRIPQLLEDVELAGRAFQSDHLCRKGDLVVVG
jgi:hypothetical protein